MDDAQTMCAMEIDESYVVRRVLTNHEAGATELVASEGGELCVRKRIPRALANPQAWATAMMLDCPRVAKVVQLYTLPDQLVVVTQYVPGRSLSEIVDSEGPLGARAAVNVSLQVAEAAAALHAVGIVHRDIKPSNVIMGANGAVLVDLGSARLHDESAVRDTTLLGTAGFAAPEQYGFAQTDARSDIYSIGRLMAYLVEGDTEAEGSAAAAVAFATDPLDAKVLSQRSSDAYAAIAQRCCAFEPSARYQTDAELMCALRELGYQIAPVDASVPDVTPNDAVSSDNAVAPGNAVTLDNAASPDRVIDPGNVREHAEVTEAETSDGIGTPNVVSASPRAEAIPTSSDAATAKTTDAFVANNPASRRMTGLTRLRLRAGWDELRLGYRHAAGSQRAVAWTLGVLGALLVALMLYSMGFAPKDHLAQGTPWLYPVAYITLAGTIAWDGFELVEWALRCGPYEVRRGRLRRLVARLLKVVAICLATLVAEVILALAIGG
ncbi:MAG: serine/threonine-protein kinase [Atopobiaceae bacterium]